MNKNTNKQSETRQRSHGSHRKDWLLSFYVLSLVAAVAVGVLGERHFGYSSTLIKKNQLLQMADSETSEGAGSLAEKYEDLLAQTAALKTRVDLVEKQNVRLSDNLKDVFPETADALQEPGTDDGSFVWQDDPDMDSDLDRELQNRLSYLNGRVDSEYTRTRLLDLLLDSDMVAMDRVPTGYPVEMSSARISSPFGWRTHPVTHRGTMHTGVDFATTYGSDIYAASSGMVVFAGYRNGYGYTVDISHGYNVTTRYAHASKVEVKAGDLVRKGQKIAEIGTSGVATGPHLHFETRVNGTPVDPLDMLGHDPEEIAGKLSQDAMDALRFFSKG